MSAVSGYGGKAAILALYHPVLDLLETVGDTAGNFRQSVSQGWL